MLKIGNTNINNIKIGNNQIAKIYLGNTKIWENKFLINYSFSNSIHSDFQRNGYYEYKSAGGNNFISRKNYNGKLELKYLLASGIKYFRCKVKFYTKDNYSSNCFLIGNMNSTYYNAEYHSTNDVYINYNKFGRYRERAIYYKNQNGSHNRLGDMKVNYNIQYYEIIFTGNQMIYKSYDQNGNNPTVVTRNENRIPKAIHIILDDDINGGNWDNGIISAEIEYKK